MEYNVIKNEFNIFKSDGSGFWNNFFSFLKKNKKKLTKNDLRILFIDDNDFPILDTLKKAGFACKRIKDIVNAEADEIKNSHIIFVDYKGVGKNLSPTEEGIGVAKLLRKTYGKTKYIVLYSARSIPNSIFLEVGKPETANMCIQKGAAPTKYMEIIEKAFDEINS